MLTFRTRPPFAVDWTEISISGDDEEAVASILKARLDGAEWDILVARDGGEFLSWDEQIL